MGSKWAATPTVRGRFWDSCISDVLWMQSGWESDTSHQTTCCHVLLYCIMSLTPSPHTLTGAPPLDNIEGCPSPHTGVFSAFSLDSGPPGLGSRKLDIVGSGHTTRSYCHYDHIDIGILDVFGDTNDLNYAAAWPPMVWYAIVCNTHPAANACITKNQLYFIKGSGWAWTSVGLE